jgi:hypothetical protein
MTAPRDVVRERQLIQKHRQILEAWWRAHGRATHTWVALDAATGRISAEPEEMPPTPSVVVRMERVSRQVVRLRRVEAIERLADDPDDLRPILSDADEPPFATGLSEEIPVSSSIAQPQLELVEPAPPPAAREKRSFITLRQQLAVRDTLQEVLRPVDGGLWVYVPGHSDRTVAEGCAFRCTEHNVAGVRLELFGALRKVVPQQLSDGDRVARLERTVAMLCEQLGVEPCQ